MIKQSQDGTSLIKPKVSKTYECPGCKSTQSHIELDGFEGSIPVLTCTACKYTGLSFKFEGIWVT